MTYELVWDGVQKHFSELSQEPNIWSASTLYTQEDKLLRKQWFQNWLNNQSDFTQQEILKFHHNSEIGTPDNSLRMKRSDVETVSVTSVKKNFSDVEMNYQALVKTS